MRLNWGLFHWRSPAPRRWLHRPVASAAPRLPARFKEDEVLGFGSIGLTWFLARVFTAPAVHGV